MKNIIFFDDKCVLCNFWVKTLLKVDKKKNLYFSSTKSKYAQTLNNKDMEEYISFLYEDKLYIKSRAILNILIALGGFWQVFIVFKIVPTFLLDFIYDLIAKNRYKIFAKDESCIIQNKKYFHRMID